MGSVIDCDPTKISIKKAIDRLINKEFSQSRGQIIQLFGNGTTADKVCEILESVSLDGILKKHFHDIPIQQNSDF